ncbi:hypothetical protein ACIO3O_34590 [Streptomyces sp. NPDC087440]|uniref:helix-turn-helix transcriptional regulator n=1 Tax=Streptomyces sp. NPDC087440 TaxID=3365790 RepID=UPI00381C5900
MHTNAPTMPALLAEDGILAPSVQRLLHLFAQGVSTVKAHRVYGIRPLHAEKLLRKAARVLETATAEPGEIMVAATVRGVLPPPPAGRRDLSDQALVFLADLALGKTMRTIAAEYGLTEGELNTRRKHVVAELDAHSYTQAVYLAIPTLLDLGEHELPSARARLAASRTSTPAPAGPPAPSHRPGDHPLPRAAPRAAPPQITFTVEKKQPS